MLKEIKGYIITSDMVNDFIQEAERMIEAYGWQEMTVAPYSFEIKITKIINDLKDYDRCTRGSREYLVMLANGLARIMNKWEEYEQQPKVRVMIISSGNVKELRQGLANDMIAAGLCIAI